MNKKVKETSLEKALKKMQIFFIPFALPPLYEIIQALGGTTSCNSFDISYKILIYVFFVTGIISFYLYKQSKDNKEVLLYVPLLFILIFILQYLTYRFDYLEIYEQSVGGLKTYDSFTDEGNYCDKFLIRLLQK